MIATSDERLNHEVRAYYDDRVRRFGATRDAVDQAKADRHELRMRIVCDVLPLAARTIHEVGCGVGHLADYIHKHCPTAHYSGCDISPEMIDAARRRHPKIEYSVRDVLDGDSIGMYDVVVATGLFYTKLEFTDGDWGDWVRRVIRRMFAMSRHAIAFNLMSDQVDFRAAHLYYSNPGEMFEFCRRELARHVVLRHEYPLYEYTLYVYREPPAARDHHA